MADQTNISKAQKLLEEMNAKYGATPSAPAQQPTQPPQQPTQPPQQRGLVNDAMSLIKGRQQQIDKASGYACGGKVKAHASGGKVKTIKGPGTSTSDSIPAKVKETGEPILVSNGERILSKKQDKLLEKIAKMLGYETTDDLLASGTGRPVGPTMKDGKRAARWGANGEWIQEEETTETQNNGIYTSDGASLVGDFKNWQAKKIADTNAKIDLATGKVPANQASEKLTLPENPAMSPNQSGVLAKLTGSYPTSTTENYVEQNQATSPLVTGRNDKGIITADSAQAAYGNDMRDNKVGPNGQKTTIFGTYDGAGYNERIAKSLGYSSANDFNNKWNEKYRDDAPPPGGWAPGIIGNGSLGTLPGGQSIEEWNNTVGMSAGDKAKYTLARQGIDNGRYSTDVQAQRAAGHDQMLMRGQDMQAQSEAARLAGTPFDKARAAEADQLTALRGKLLDPKTPKDEQDRIKEFFSMISKKADPRSSEWKVGSVKNADGTETSYISDGSSAYALDALAKQTAQRGQEKPVPAGYTVAGTYNGKRVLQDVKGNRFLEG